MDTECPIGIGQVLEDAPKRLNRLGRQVARRQPLAHDARGYLHSLGCRTGRCADGIEQLRGFSPPDGGHEIVNASASQTSQVGNIVREGLRLGGHVRTDDVVRARSHMR